MKRIYLKLSNHVWGLFIKPGLSDKKEKENFSSFSWHCWLYYYTLIRTFQTFINKIIFTLHSFEISSNSPNTIYFSPFKTWRDILSKEILSGHIWSNYFERFQSHVRPLGTNIFLVTLIEIQKIVNNLSLFCNRKGIYIKIK